MATIEVQRVETDGLSRQVWRFHATTGFGSAPTVLRVEYYGQETRASSRHKWVRLPKTRYAALDDRPYNSGIEAKDVPLPVDVAAQAKDLFMHSVEVVGPLIRENR